MLYDIIMRRKIRLLILLGMICVGIAGYFVIHAAMDKKDEAYKRLVAGEWSRYETTTGEKERICFDKSGEFSYYCSCGEPIGDSDLYERYSYKGEGKIVLLGSDGEKQDINIMYVDEKTLSIKIGEDTIEFYNEKR